MKLFKSHSRLNVCSNFFIQRVIGSWNSLPDEIVNIGVRTRRARGHVPPKKIVHRGTGMSRSRD